MIPSFPSFPIWIIKGIYKGLKIGVKDFYNKVKEVSVAFYWMFRGIIIGFYIINATLFGYEDKRIKQHGWTLKGMKQAALFYWVFVIGLSAIIIGSLYGVILFVIFSTIILSYSMYSNQKEEYYKGQSQFSKESNKEETRPKN